MLDSTVYWGEPFNGEPNATLEAIGHFDARGMRRVYGRGDHFKRVFNMDIWKDRNDRLLARFLVEQRRRRW